jgi:hypothetical protein
MDTTWIFLALEFLLILLYLAIFSFITIPGGLKAYDHWSKSKNPKDMSRIVFFAFLSIYVGSLAAVDLIRLVLKYDAVISYGVNREILGILLLLIVYHLTVPNAVRCFRKWKLTNKKKCFSVMALLILLSIYALSIVFITFIPTLISLRIQ